jgi:hypothetical protein
MERPARLFLCARCRDQVLLCSDCDRGNRYCSSACANQARDAAQREAARRYQCSHRGRLAHAARSRRWRRGRQCEAQHEANNVTHQGSQATSADAPLAVWTHDSATSSLDDIAAAALAPQDPNVPTTPWLCCRCGVPLSNRVRQGFLRHGSRAMLPAGRRHDRSP